jgi:hypothetical protein
MKYIALNEYIIVEEEIEKSTLILQKQKGKPFKVKCVYKTPEYEKDTVFLIKDSPGNIILEETETKIVFCVEKHNLICKLVK